MPLWTVRRGPVPNNGPPARSVDAVTETPDLPRALDPSDELGQEEAVDLPDEEVEADEYVEDPDYDPGNDDIDPDSISEGLGALGPELPAEGGDI